ncbi:MAG: DsbA family protein [Cycloclasticus sp.]
MKHYFNIAVLGLLITFTASNEVQAIKEPVSTQSQIEALKAGQAEIRKDLADIKKLLQPKKRAQQVSNVNQVLDISAAPSKGNKTAPLTIVEFVDYQCPYCAKHFKSVLPLLIKNYVDTGKVRYVLRDFPLSFHKNATVAAYAAHCAGDQGKYWEMHDILFKNPRALGKSKLPAHAKAIGLDTEKFNACLSGNSHQARVNANMGDGRKLGVKGTPSFVIGFTLDNGNSVKGEKMIRGAVGYNVFRKTVEGLLATKQ